MIQAQFSHLTYAYLVAYFKRRIRRGYKSSPMRKQASAQYRMTLHHVGHKRLPITLTEPLLFSRVFTNM